MAVREINGDAEDNVIKDRQGAGAALIKAGFGHDQVWGRDGHDIIYGGYGSDTIYGGAGNDELYSFRIDGSDLHSDLIDIAIDRIYGEGGDDVIFFYGGFFLGPVSSAIGGAGDDVVNVFGDTKVTAWGGFGDDYLSVYGSGEVAFYGESGRDILITINQELEPWSDFRDLSHGGAGKDMLIFDYDEVYGGAGNDNLIFQQKPAAGPGRLMGADIHLGAGNDYLEMYTHYFPAHGNLNWLHVYDANVKQGDHGTLLIHMPDLENIVVTRAELDSDGNGRLDRADNPTGQLAGVVDIIQVDDNLQFVMGNTRLMFVGRIWIEADFFN
jgi:Ca2+-binding RTX toxin-like protein